MEEEIMDKFRKKPIEVFAQQFTGDRLPGMCIKKCRPAMPGPHIHGNEGYMSVHMDDWVVTFADKHQTVMKPEIFEEVYEKV